MTVKAYACHSPDGDLGFWALPIPPGLDITTAGPLFCGGITVFSPLIQHRISAMSHGGVVHEVKASVGLLMGKQRSVTASPTGSQSLL